MSHLRSPKAMRKRLARRIIFGTSFHDRERAETVARVNVRYTEKLGHNVTLVDVERGEILKDNRGRGTMQQIARVSREGR